MPLQLQNITRYIFDFALTTLRKIQETEFESKI